MFSVGIDNEWKEYKPLSKLWKIRDIDGNYDVGTYKQGSMEATVTDQDGDGTHWEVRQHGKILSDGYIDPIPYVSDFYEGIREVEEILIREKFLYRP